MNDSEPEDDQRGLPFRDLFSEDETRDFIRPVFQLPTRRIAFGSIGLSVVLSVALVVSSLNAPKRPVGHPKPVPDYRKNLHFRPAEYRKTDTTQYLRQPTR
ncbi:hypothetical protein ACFPMF_24200 [Larkinella bovis]|uniref:Uncharacterized protein n=1 Tax=Larkinella bovis TaxID=683041 RepID=A0ABW0IGN7_9BACT